MCDPAPVAVAGGSSFGDFRGRLVQDRMEL
jgi:hypothetical protein